MQGDLVEAVQTLHSGGVVAHPTETCYGLAVDVFQKKAVQSLYRLKQMPMDKPVSILVRDLEEAKRYGVFSQKAELLARQYWPGPLTLILPRTVALPAWINPGMDSVGIRVSSNKKSRHLVEAFGGPLTTTSANVSGQPQAYKPQDFLDQSLQPDFIWDGGQIGKELPSTIVKVNGEDLQLIRQGPISL